MRAALKLLPLLALYALLVGSYIAGHPDLRVDERRYVSVAQALAHDQATAENRLGFWDGPGFPILLVPFVKLGLPWDSARPLNVVLLFAAFLYFNRTLARYVGKRATLLGTYALGLYPPLLDIAPRLMTEPIAVFLACGFTYHFTAAQRRDRDFAAHVVLSAIYLSYLALTKVLFGYVIAVCLVLFLARYAYKRYRTDLVSLVAFGLALLACTPYLSFTHKLTGKTFYWASSGGLSLYWMSTPFENEYGDFQAPVMSALRPLPADSAKAGRGENHREFLDRMNRLSAWERDDSLKAQALRNIRSHPGKFARNWLANLGRLFLDYPFSYKPQTGATYLALLPGIFLISAIVASIYPTVVGRHRIPYELGASICFAVVYMGASSLLSGYNRMLLPAMPILVMWVTFVFSRLLRIEIGR